MRFLVLLALLGSCAGQPAVRPEPPRQVDTVAFAIRRSVLLRPPGCTGVEVADGVVVTAKHCLNEGAVAGDAFGNSALAGTIRYVSPRHDFAVIEYPRLQPGIHKIAIRDYVIGEHVYIVGFPTQLRSGEQELTVTDGLMAGPVDSEGTARTTAEAYFGNSGGGVWGEDGALLGILVSINAVPSAYGPMPYPAQTYMVPMKHVFKHIGG
jgi:hypothetical protein